jgi:hypothetical protein
MQMLWLIWIALMLVTPIVVGIAVWRQTHAQPAEVPVGEPGVDV